MRNESELMIIKKALIFNKSFASYIKYIIVTDEGLAQKKVDPLKLCKTSEPDSISSKDSEELRGFNSISSSI